MWRFDNPKPGGNFDVFVKQNEENRQKMTEHLVQLSGRVKEILSPEQGAKFESLVGYKLVKPAK